MPEFHVPQMSCGHCKAAVERSLLALDPDAEINVDLPSKLVRVRTALAPSALIRALEEAGYPADQVV